MSLLLATAGESVAASDTFLMAQFQILHPILYTGSSGTWNWNPNTSSIFAGYLINATQASGDYIEFDNVVFQEGEDYEILVIGAKTSTRGAATAKVNGVAVGSNLDLYNAGNAFNQIISTGTFTAPASGTLRFELTSAAYWSPGQIIVRRLSGTGLGASLDDLPWNGDCPAFSIYSAEYNNGGWIDYKSTITPTQTSSAAWGSHINIGHATYDWRVKYRFWCPQGTHTLNFRHLTGTGGGTITATVNGGATTPTTFSTSAGGTNYNVSSSLTFTAATTGMQELELSGSGGDTCALQWISWRKTSAIGAITATGATYGRETMELWPWFADNHTGFDTFAISSAYLHYGVFFNPISAINQYEDWATGIKGGTYDVDLITTLYTGRGIAHLSNGGADLGTIDLYSASLTYNAARAFSSVSLDNLHPIKVSMDSKNTSSSAYQNTTSFYRLTRTGA